MRLSLADFFSMVVCVGCCIDYYVRPWSFALLPSFRLFFFVSFFSGILQYLRGYCPISSSFLLQLLPRCSSLAVSSGSYCSVCFVLVACVSGFPLPRCCPVPLVLLLCTCPDRVVLAAAVVVDAAIVTVAALASVDPSAVVAVALVVLVVVALAAFSGAVAAVVRVAAVVLFGPLFLYALAHIASSFLVECRLGSSGHCVAVVVSRIVLVSYLPWCLILHALLIVSHLSSRSFSHIWCNSMSLFLLRIAACLFCFPVFFLVVLVFLVLPCIH